MPKTPHTPDETTPVANRMASRVAPFWSREKVCAELNLDRRELNEAVHRLEILAPEISDGELVFPVAQFEKVDGRTRVRPGIAAMLPVLRDGDPWSVAQLLTATADELGSKSPYEAERDGATLDELVEYAHAVNAYWAN